MQQRAEQEILMTMGPSSGLVPKDTLSKANKQVLKDLENKEKSAGELLWTEREPDNFAGRIRKSAN